MRETVFHLQNAGNVFGVRFYKIGIDNNILVHEYKIMSIKLARIGNKGN